jgi:hypothetical protein
MSSKDDRQKAIDGLIEISRELAEIWEPSLDGDMARYQLAEHVGGLRVLLKRIDDTEEERGLMGSRQLRRAEQAWSRKLAKALADVLVENGPGEYNSQAGELLDAFEAERGEAIDR